MPSTPVSIATDMTMPLIPPVLTWHDWVSAPVPAPTPSTLSLETPVTIMWPPGFALLQNKLTTTVLHKMMPLALDGHNCGYMIPHVTIPVAPPNLLLPMQIMFSSRKMAFSSSTVKANGAQVACNLIVFLPMTCCANPVTLPLGTAITNIGNNVMVGLTWMDILAGWVNIGITMVADKLLRPKSGPSAPKYGDWKAMFEKFVGPLSTKALKDLAKKTAVGLLTSAVRLALTGQGSVSVKVGSDYANVGATFSKGNDGQWSIAAAAQAGGPINPATGSFGAIQGKYQYTHGSDGSTTSAFSGSTSEGQAVGPGGVGAKQTASTASTTDASGHHSTKTTTGNQVVGAEPGLPGQPTGFDNTSQTTTKSAPGKPTTTETINSKGGRVLGTPFGPQL